jgi:hypothetical protein
MWSRCVQHRPNGAFCNDLVVREGWGNRQGPIRTHNQNECLRSDFFVSLFLASSDVLYAIHGKSKNDMVEKFQMLVLLCYQLRKGLNHQVQVVDFVAEPLLLWFQHLFKLTTSILGNISQCGFVGNFLKSFVNIRTIGEVFDVFTFCVQAGRTNKSDKTRELPGDNFSKFIKMIGVFSELGQLLICA